MGKKKTKASEKKAKKMKWESVISKILVAVEKTKK